MNDHPVHRDDITALDREGDLPDYMRSLIRPTRTPTPNKPRRDRRRWGAISIPPDHKPGQWPPGTSPPGPSPERSLPPEAWAAASRHYSNEVHRPDQPCDCGNCPATEETGETK
ncbi:hypothetical protein ACJWDR_37735 [Streptomyces tauricus]|uniref:hypothetical protein n=1 Tax=Streptomyces tauricus TaxID=68274 RepID=UPI00387EE927